MLQLWSWVVIKLGQAAGSFIIDAYPVRVEAGDIPYCLYNRPFHRLPCRLVSCPLSGEEMAYPIIIER
ncbi:MAG: hypothetical protein ACLRS8_03845 [Parabacteroides merdae]